MSDNLKQTGMTINIDVNIKNNLKTVWYLAGIHIVEGWLVGRTASEGDVVISKHASEVCLARDGSYPSKEQAMNAALRKAEELLEQKEK